MPSKTSAVNLGGTGPDKLVLTMSEDRYLGDAQFYVTMDGVQVGGLQTAQALRSAGAGQDFVLNAALGSGAHTIGVRFVNDAYGTLSAGEDRNLYLDAVKLNGVDQGVSAALLANGEYAFKVGTPAAAPAETVIGTGSQVLAITVSEDAYLGDALFDVSVDGKVVATGLQAQALHGAGQSQLFTIKGEFGTGSHAVAVTFTNDAYGGAAGLDRNLYVQSIKFNGIETLPAGQGTLLANSSVTTQTAGASPLVDLGGTGPDRLVLTMSEDYYLGDAQFYVTVDGVQVGGLQTTQAIRSAGAGQDFVLNAALGSGAHKVGVRFVNDAYGSPNAGEDRNLYLNAVKLNGVDLGVSAALMANGEYAFKVGTPAAPPAETVIGTGSQVLAITVSEDEYLGDALFDVSVDGKVVATGLQAQALHGAGQSQLFTIKGEFGTGSHAVAVSFTNDAYGGAAGLDRNLYVQSVKFNGTETLSAGQGTLLANGAVTTQGSFAAATTPPVTNTVPAATTPAATTPAATTPATTTPATTTPTTTTPAPVVTAPASTYGSDGTEGLVAVGAPVYKAGSHVITVGVGKDYARIDDAIAASQDGDVLLVDAGTYTDQSAKVYHKIDIIGVGGRVVMNTTVDVPNQKGILVPQTDLRVVNIDFVGAHISSDLGHNAAGIRVDGGNIVIENCQFIDNQNGILTNSGKDVTVSIDHSVFDHNGGNDENNVGNTHNIYIGDIASFRMTNSVSKEAQIGHELKSRAELNVITNNRIESGTARGTGSYAIDLPNGGKDTVTNNTIVKGPGAENHTIIHFGGEGIPYAKSSLLLQGNLILNTQENVTGILNQTSITAIVTGNKIQGLDYAALMRGPATLSANVDGSGTAYSDSVLTGVLPGSTTIYTEDDKTAHSVTLNGGQIQAVQGGGGLLTVDVIAGHIVALGGSGGMVVNESKTSGTGANQYVTLAGSVNTLNLTGGGSIDSEGTDTITTGEGNSAGQLNGVSRVTQAGAGTITWAVNGTSAIQLGQGSTFMSLGDSANLTLTGTTSFFRVDGGGGNLVMDTVNGGRHVSGSILGGAWTLQTYDGMIHMTTSAGTQGVDMTMGDGDLQFISKGADVLHAGSGATTVQVAGNAKVYAGTGSLEFFGFGSSGADLYGNGGTYLLGGDTGNITYHGGDRDSTLNNQLGRGTILGGAGRLTINGSTWDRVVGGSGGIVLNQNGGGADTITTAAGSSNVLNLSGGNVVTSNGSDTITWGAANGTMQLNGQSQVAVQGGNSQFTVAGRTAMTIAGGHDSITLLAGSSASLDAKGYQVLHGDGAALDLRFVNDQGGASAMRWNGGTMDAWTDTNGGIHAETSGAAGSAITASGSLDLVTRSTTAVTLGSGSSRLGVFGSGTSVAAGSGDAVVNGGGTGGTFRITGGTGAITADSGAMDMTFIGGAGTAALTGGSVAIIAGSGTVTASGFGVKSFVGGAGKADITLADGAKVTLGAGASHFSDRGGPAAEVFTLTAASVGKAIIDNFSVGTDKIALTGGVRLVSQSVYGGAAHLLFSNGGDVTLTGVSDTRTVFA